MALDKERRAHHWAGSGRETVVDATLHELAALGGGKVPITNLALDGHHVRDCFLDLLADCYARLRQGPNAFTKRQLDESIGEVYLATYEVDWKLAGPWLVEAAIEAVRELRETGRQESPRFFWDS